MNRPKFHRQVATALPEVLESVISQLRIGSSSSSAGEAVIDLHPRLNGGLPPDCRPTATDLATTEVAELLPESDFSERQLDDRLAAGTLENVISLFWVGSVSSLGRKRPFSPVRH